VGGGIYNNGTLTLSSGSIVTGNIAYDDHFPDGTVFPSAGGGVYNNGMMTLSGSTVTGNTAYGAGGGIYNDAQGYLTIVSSVVSNNTASDGADICSFGSITISKDSSIGSKVSHK
jgi:hypothetical protein